MAFTTNGETSRKQATALGWKPSEALKALAGSTPALSAMAKETYYRQCGYQQAHPNEEGGRKFDVAWLPEKLAKVGQIIYFGDKRDGVPREDLYQVTWVGDNRRDISWLREKQNADKHQREKSDVERNPDRSHMGF